MIDLMINDKYRMIYNKTILCLFLFKRRLQIGMGEDFSPFTYLPLQLHLFIIFILLDKTMNEIQFIQIEEYNYRFNKYNFQEEKR